MPELGLEVTAVAGNAVNQDNRRLSLAQRLARQRCIPAPDPQPLAPKLGRWQRALAARSRQAARLPPAGISRNGQASHGNRSCCPGRG